MIITTSEIADIYVHRELRSGNLTRDTPLPLCQISLCNDPMTSAFTRFNSVVCNIANLKSKEHLKVDPIASMFNEVDGTRAADAKQYNRAVWGVKNRENYLPELGSLLLSLADCVEISPLPQIDAVLVDNDWKPIAVLKTSKTERITSQVGKDFEEVLGHDSPYHGCIPLYISRVPNGDGEEKPLFSEDHPLAPQYKHLNIRSIGLQSFFTKYCKNDSLYIDALVVTAQAMHKEGKLEHNYDMRSIFNLL